MDSSNESSPDVCPTIPGLSREGGFRPGLDWSYVKSNPQENWHVIGWLICLLLLFVTWIVSIVTITKHLRNYYKPGIQRHKLRVILFPPVYATLAWFSYLRYDYATTIMFFATMFESFAVFNLYTSLQAYLKPFRVDAGSVKEPADTKIMFIYKFHLNSKWGMHYSTINDILVFQYPIWSLIDSFISIFAELRGRYCEGSYDFNGAYVYLTIINFVSLSVILGALFSYLEVFKNEFKMGRIPSHGMFWCVKGPIMVIFYFGEVLLTILTTRGVIKATHGVVDPTTGEYLSIPWPADAVKNGVYVILICFTMFVDCFMMFRIFGPDDNIKKALEKGQPKRMNYFKAFADAYLAYIPHFLWMCFGCFIDSCRLCRKRRQMKKRDPNTTTMPGLLHDYDSSPSDLHPELTEAPSTSNHQPFIPQQPIRVPEGYHYNAGGASALNDAYRDENLGNNYNHNGNSYYSHN